MSNKRTPEKRRPKTRKEMAHEYQLNVKTFCSYIKELNIKSRRLISIHDQDRIHELLGLPEFTD